MFINWNKNMSILIYFSLFNFWHVVILAYIYVIYISRTGKVNHKIYFHKIRAIRTPLICTQANPLNVFKLNRLKLSKNIQTFRRDPCRKPQTHSSYTLYSLKWPKEGRMICANICRVSINIHYSRMFYWSYIWLLNISLQNLGISHLCICMPF